MGEPLSPDCGFDFPMDDPHPAYNFFAPGSLPGFTCIPNTTTDGLGPTYHCWESRAEPQGAEGIEEDLATLFGDDDFEDDDSEGFDEEEV
ncbi:hypothetical protein Tco_0903740 [Tanacetum coccineum]